jgi:queuosine precursor transporter
MYKYYSLISCLFTATLLISNTLDSKIFVLGPMALPAGIILFPLAYVFGDILTEVYGYRASRRIIWIGFFSLLLMVTSYEIARLLPSAPFWDNQTSFERVLGIVPRIAFASAAAFITGEFCNAYVLAKIKVRMNGQALSLRLVASTVVGQAVDTSVFVLIAYTGVVSLASMWWVALSGWAFKVAWEVFALPITLILVRFLKKEEQEDYFDIDTDFNPFRSRDKVKSRGSSTIGQNTVP